MFTPKEMYEIFTKRLRFYDVLWTVDTLIDKESRDKVSYAPECRKKHVWTPEKDTFYIESLLLGSEIPPYTVYVNSKAIREIVDGRQRHEALLRFCNDQFALDPRGLHLLKTFEGKLFSELPKDVQNLLKETSVRVLEVRETEVIDDLKKEYAKKMIKRRYNAGMTALKAEELDKAKYINNDLMNYINEKLNEDERLIRNFLEFFIPNIKYKESEKADIIEKILRKIRFLFVIQDIPMMFYLKHQAKSELVEKYYAALKYNDNVKDGIYNNFLNKISVLEAGKFALEIKGVKYNECIFDCLYWALSCMEQRNIKFEICKRSEFLSAFTDFIQKNTECFLSTDIHYQRRKTDQFKLTAKFFENYFELDFTDNFEIKKDYEEFLKNLIKEDPNQIMQKELNLYRLTKLEPQPFSISEIIKKIKNNRIMIRPPYQRKEKINKIKASGIIESILIDIRIPPIFIYQRLDGVWEVIDGQQRLLTLIGYLGLTYFDENGREQKSNNDKFKLQNLEILTSANGKKFDELSEIERAKILGERIPIVIIQEKENSMFNPEDLFIRLNSKQFQIKEKSFEMWNTLLTNNQTEAIVEMTKKYSEWFYIRVPQNDTRMMNEELFTIMMYLENNVSSFLMRDNPYLFLCKKHDRLTLNLSFTHRDNIKHYLKNLCIKNSSYFVQNIIKTEEFINKLKLFLSNGEEVPDVIIKDEFNALFPKNSKKGRRIYMFLFLWCMISPLSKETLKNNLFGIRNYVQKLIGCFAYNDNPNIDMKTEFKNLLDKYEKEFLIAKPNNKVEKDADVQKVKDSKKGTFDILEKNVSKKKKEEEKFPKNVAVNNSSNNSNVTIKIITGDNNSLQ